MTTVEGPVQRHRQASWLCRQLGPSLRTPLRLRPPSLDSAPVLTRARPIESPQSTRSWTHPTRALRLRMCGYTPSFTSIHVPSEYIYICMHAWQGLGANRAPPCRTKTWQRYTAVSSLLTPGTRPSRRLEVCGRAVGHWCTSNMPPSNQSLPNREFVSYFTRPGRSSAGRPRSRRSSGVCDVQQPHEMLLLRG
jgi:hypothetical protein